MFERLLTLGDPPSVCTTNSPLLFADTVLHVRTSTRTSLCWYRFDDDGMVQEVDVELVPFDPMLVKRVRRGGLEIASVDGLDWGMNLACPGLVGYGGRRTLNHTGVDRNLSFLEIATFLTALRARTWLTSGLSEVAYPVGHSLHSVVNISQEYFRYIREMAYASRFEGSCAPWKPCS